MSSKESPGTPILDAKRLLKNGRLTAERTKNGTTLAVVITESNRSYETYNVYGPQGPLGTILLSDVKRLVANGVVSTPDAFYRRVA